MTDSPEDKRVIHLAFTNDRATPDETRMTACAYCRNKTYLICHDAGEFPFIRCAACSSVIGRIGWAN